MTFFEARVGDIACLKRHIPIHGDRKYYYMVLSDAVYDPDQITYFKSVMDLTTGKIGNIRAETVIWEMVA